MIKKNGYVIEGNDLQHRKIAEQVLNRKLEKSEVIHHQNELKEDNSPDNLMLFENQKAHARFHHNLKQFGLTNPRKREIEARKITNIAKSLDHDHK